MFGASWLRFGSTGPLVIVAALVAVLVAGILIVIPRWAAVVTAFSVGWAAILLFVVGAGALLGTSAFLHRTSVRGT